MESQKDPGEKLDMDAYKAARSGSIFIKSIRHSRFL